VLTSRTAFLRSYDLAHHLTLLFVSEILARIEPKIQRQVPMA
jgi:hypothetical protein